MTSKCLTRPARLLASVFIMGLVIGTASAQPAGLDWRQFSDRLGTRVDYPAALFSETPASGENGVTLARPDGRAQLRIFTVANARGETPRSFLRRQFPFNRATLAYDRVTPTSSRSRRGARGGSSTRAATSRNASTASNSAIHNPRSARSIRSRRGSACRCGRGERAGLRPTTDRCIKRLRGQPLVGRCRRATWRQGTPLDYFLS